MQLNVFIISLLKLLQNQQTSALPEDVNIRVEKASIPSLINELSKSTSLNRQGLSLLRKKIALSHYLEKLVNNRNSIGGDLKVEETRAFLKKPVISLELKQLINCKPEDRQKLFDDFLNKHELTLDLFTKARNLDILISDTEKEINLTKSALVAYERKLYDHMKTFDQFVVPKSLDFNEVSRPPDIKDLITEATQKIPLTSTGSNASASDILSLAEHFAK